MNLCHIVMSFPEFSSHMSSKVGKNCFTYECTIIVGLALCITTEMGLQEVQENFSHTRKRIPIGDRNEIMVSKRRDKNLHLFTSVVVY